MMYPVVQVALGGALGAVARHGVNLLGRRWPGFPASTLAVNVIGSLLMGVLVVVLAERGAMRHAPLLMTGVLGGFTTFSAFSLDAVALWERGQPGLAALYVAGSLGLSIGALIAGLWLARGYYA
ncbi:fluoride efflux transporter CrcB [Paracoccus sp. p4-l81]|uniref:fluoride efflux transporter CrcB n=1 Tax=unclassified Paracoccus (in: a-proteobacteria) TaxID=2688777 RepID=UPI0035B7650A